MPVYEYRCDGCGHVFEELVGHGAEPVCPRCQGAVHKLFSKFNCQTTEGACADLPKGEARELCTECRRGGGACPLSP